MEKEIVDGCYELGLRIKNGVLDKKDDVLQIVHKLKSSQINKKDFMQAVLEVVVDYKAGPVEKFMLGVINGSLDPTEVCFAVCVGIMSENIEFDKNDYISLKKASELYGKADSTLRVNIKNEKFKEGEDCYKEGKTWYIKKTALDREYGSEK